MQWRKVPWVVISAVALASAWLTMTSEFGQRIEFDVSDVGARLLQHEIESDVVIVAIDAKSLAELAAWPWPRASHAELIDKIAEAVPRRLFIDVDFSTHSNPVDDARLAAAFSDWRGEPIVLPAFYQYATSTTDERRFTRPMADLLPFAALGSVNLFPSADGLVRRMQRSWQVDGRVLPSVPDLLLPGPSEAGADDLLIDYAIDPASFDYVSYSDVLANRIAAERFAGKTVFVGATAIELGDMVSVPNYRSRPGVVTLALAFESLRAGAHATLPEALYWALAAVWAALLGFAFCRLSWRRNIAVAVGALLLAWAVVLYLYAVPRISVQFVPFALSAVLAYGLATLRSLESETLRAIAFSVGIIKRDALLKSIVQSSTDAIICVDAEGRIMTANPAASELFSCPHAELRRASILDFIPALLQEPRDSFEALTGNVTEWEARARKAEAGFPVDVSISRIMVKDEHLYTAIIRDISERKAQQRQLQFQATHDPLTTLPNRPALAAHLDAVLARSTLEQSAALLMIDLNRFKEVNDTLGHNVGDYVLYEAARRLADVVADRGFIARIGGDEFALVVHGDEESLQVAALSRELVDCLKEPVQTCGVSIDIGLSIGIARFPADADDAETLLKRADIAMYVAKSKRSGFQFYDAAHDGHSIRKLTIASRLRKAIANDELELHFQPQVNLSTSRAESVEALLRWEDAALGKVSPDEFIGLAETTDLIQPLTDWTLVTGFRQLAQWQSQGLNLRVAINISARVLQDGGFPRRIGAMLQRMGVPPELVELEITESAVMVDPEHALEVVRELASLGVLISIDDFGTGYSSLSYLRDLPVHAVKLDKSFVIDLERNDDNRVIVESTVQMAHALKLEIIAEGTESESVVKYLTGLGYDYAQGYWYSAALPPGALSAWVRQFNSATAERGTPNAM